MRPTREKLIGRIDEFIEKGRVAIANPEKPGMCNGALCVRFRNPTLSFIRNFFGTESEYYSSFNYHMGNWGVDNVERSIAILEELKEELEGGWDTTLKNLITSEIFTDFLDMATYLLSEDYKDAAAVMIGGVLEEHLRQLCLENEIEIRVDKKGKKIPKRAAVLNDELAKEEVYNKLSHKQVISWLDLRNNAAHGNYKEYTAEQVENMAGGVLDFIARTS